MRDNLADLRIELRPIDALLPWARNPRLHSEAQIAQIAASMVEFGWTNPILVDGKNGVIAGHGRLLAACKLGLKQVPVVELAHLSETQKRAYVIADNQLSLASAWDQDLLRVELEALREDDFDLALTGFDPDELAKLLDGEEPDNEGLTDDDEVPEPEEQAVSKPGDLWLLGEHKLLCGDATRAADYVLLLGDELVDMVVTDPPYCVNYGNSAKDRLRGKARPMLNDDLGEAFGAFLLAACREMLAVTKGALYIAMSSSELDTLQRAFRSAGGHWSTFVIWAKHTFTLGRADYQRQYEPILYGWKDGHERYWCGARDQGDVWFFKKPARNDLHPTMKPVELVERAIRNSSKTRDLVLDPFGGSGTTLIACEKTGRRGRLIELDPKYCDVTIRRFEEWSGKKATRQDGVSFDEVSEGLQAAIR